MDPRRELMRKQYPMAALTSAALVTILPLFAFVVWVMLGEPPVDGYTPLSEIMSIVWTFGLLALGAAVLSFWVMPFLLRSGAAAAERGVVAPTLVQHAVDGRVDPLDAYAANMMIANLTSSALSEVPLLLGFVLTIMTGQWLVFAVGAAITATLWAVHFPRLSRWEQFLSAEEARRSGVPQIIRT